MSIFLGNFLFVDLWFCFCSHQFEYTLNQKQCFSVQKSPECPGGFSEKSDTLISTNMVSHHSYLFSKM